MATDIPFNRSPFVPEELANLNAVIQSGHIHGDGPFTKKCGAFLEREFGVSRALLTTSCTHALEMAAILLDIKPGDEVIVPSYTFVSSVNAFVLRGAVPRFVDVRPDTLNLDETLLEARITSKTKVIVPVHYAGVACEMDAIIEIATAHGVHIVEDNAHGLFAKYKGKNLGTFGAFATQSFHATKNFSSGEGGALLINERQYVERAEIVREKGTDRSRFFRGEVDKYTWVDIGSSYLPSDLLAAILFAQFEAKDSIQAARARIWHAYNNELQDWAAEQGFGMPHVPAYCDHSSHIFYVMAPSLEVREALIAHLRSRGVHSMAHYLPLHTSGMGKHFGAKASDCPVAVSVGDRILRLPLFFQLTVEEQQRVISAVRDFRTK